MQQLEWDQGSQGPPRLRWEELERPEHVCLACRCVCRCVSTSVHQARLAGWRGRTRGSADGPWRGHRNGLDPGETGESESWILEGPGVAGQALERPWGLGVGYWRGHRSEPASRPCVACVHVSMHKVAGRSGGPGPATEQSECARMVTGGIYSV